MLFVKKKDCEGNDTKFEILTRSPFNGKDFRLDNDVFRELFRFTGNDRININVSNNKGDVYECLDEVFIAKLKWWNANIMWIAPLYKAVYESENTTTTQFTYLHEYKEMYQEDTGESNFIFSKDFIFFRSFFNTAEEVEYVEVVNG